MHSIISPFPFLITLFFFIGTFFGTAQVSGQFTQDGYPYPWVKVYFEGTPGKATSNFQGTFNLKVKDTSTSKTLVFEYEGLKIKLLNCSLAVNTKQKLGKIVLPKYKQLSVAEYKEMKRRDRKKCLPLYNGPTIIGYISKTELESDTLPLNCPEESGVSNFIFDPKEKTISIEWNRFIHCD